MITQPNTYLFNKLTILIDGEKQKVYNSTDDKKWYKNLWNTLVLKKTMWTMGIYG